jgi:hypothetical protein
MLGLAPRGKCQPIVGNEERARHCVYPCKNSATAALCRLDGINVASDRVPMGSCLRLYSEGLGGLIHNMCSGRG